MTDLPTIDELVEVGARAAYEVYRVPLQLPPWADAPQDDVDAFTEEARAILDGVLPLVLEGPRKEVDRAASVCETFQKSEDDGYRSRDRQYAISLLKDARSPLSSIDSLIGPRPE